MKIKSEQPTQIRYLCAFNGRSRSPIRLPNTQAEPQVSGERSKRWTRLAMSRRRASTPCLRCDFRLHMLISCLAALPNATGTPPLPRAPQLEPEPVSPATGHFLLSELVSFFFFPPIVCATWNSQASQYASSTKRRNDARGSDCCGGPA